MNDTATTSWVVRVAGRKCAAGLAWVPLIATERKAIHQELQQHLKRVGSAYGALYQQRDARYNLAGIVKAGRAGTSAGTGGRAPVAAWLAASVERLTFFVGDHGQGLWVLAAADGSIDPRGDVVIGPRDLATFIEDIAETAGDGTSIDIVLSPECAARRETVDHLGNVRIASLDEVLTAPLPKVRVKKRVGIPTWAFQVGIAIALVGGVAWGTLVVKQELADQMTRRQVEELARQKAEEERIRAMRENSQADMAVAQQVRTATATPAPIDFAAACIDAWERIPDTLGGWKRVSQACSISGAVQVTYRLPESGGGMVATENSLRAAASVRDLTVDIQWFNSTATVTAQFDVPAPREGLLPEGLPTMADAGTALSSHAQRIKRVMPEIQLVAEAPTAVKPAATDGAGPNAAEPPFHTGSLLMSGHSMWLLRAVVPSTPNVTLNTITLRREGTSLQWTAEGSFLTSRT